MKKALLQMHVAILLWGFTGVLGRAISLDAAVLVWYRMLTTLIIIGALLQFRKQWVGVDRTSKLRMAAIGGLIAIHWVAFYAAIKYSNISIALICLSTAGIFTSLLDPLLNRGRFDPFEILLGLLALLGVYLIYSYDLHAGIGIVFGVVAAGLSSVFTILNKRVSVKFPVRIVLFYEMGAGWILLSLLFPFYLMTFPHTQFFPHAANILSTEWFRNDWLWIGVMSLCCTVWAQSLSLSALKVLSPFTSSLLLNLEPAYGIVLAFIFYNENKEIIFVQGTTGLNFGFLSGMGCILLCVVLQMVKVLRKY
jgi:drug/metabolite transporter (DMT)-like permease